MWERPLPCEAIFKELAYLRDSKGTYPSVHQCLFEAIGILLQGDSNICVQQDENSEVDAAAQEAHHWSRVKGLTGLGKHSASIYVIPNKKQFIIENQCFYRRARTSVLMDPTSVLLFSHTELRC